MTIWKFELPIDGVVEMPASSEVLCVQTQYGKPCLWVKVNTTAPKVVRQFAIVGTGHQMPMPHGRYVGTFQLDEGSLVFHVFEIDDFAVAERMHKPVSHN